MMAKKILVVDDEPDTVQTFRDILESEGYEVREASSGDQALAAINGYRPDLVLLDIMMPGKTGVEVAWALNQRADACEIPIVMITALSSIPVGDRSLSEITGIKRFVFKPCSPATLLKVVSDAIQYDR